MDADEQIVDPDWARKAMGDWLADYANVRQMHSAKLAPAGKGVTLDEQPDGLYVKSRIVEPTAVKLCREGVYAAYSVGIARPRVINDRLAKGGRIVGGQIIELSLVDRPANPTCKITVAKAADWADGPDDDTLGKSVTITVPSPATGAPAVARVDGAAALAGVSAATTTPVPAPAAPAAPAAVHKGADALQDEATALHALLCPAYEWEAVKGAYPDAVKDAFNATIGPQARALLYQMLSAEVAEDGGTGKCAYDICTLAGTYRDLSSFVQSEQWEVINEAVRGELLMGAREDLVKGFALANPGITPPHPTAHPSPGQFRRPLITAGQAAASGDARGGRPRIPSSGNVSAAQFNRGALTDGHQATKGMRTFYTQAAQAQMRDALQVIHDHVAQVFPNLCAMDAVPVGGPAGDALDTGADNSPEATKGAGGSLTTPTPDPDPDPVTPPPAADAPDIEAIVKAAVEAATTPLLEKVTTLEAAVETLGSQPDPAMAPNRGVQGARAGGGPIDKVSHTGDAADAGIAKAKAEEAAEREARMAFYKRLVDTGQDVTGTAEAELEKIAAAG